MAAHAARTSATAPASIAIGLRRASGCEAGGRPHIATRAMVASEYTTDTSGNAENSPRHSSSDVGDARMTNATATRTTRVTPDASGDAAASPVTYGGRLVV